MPLRAVDVVLCAIAGVCLAAVAVTPAVAQPASLGVFRWQLAPFCNVLTLSIAQRNGVYEVDGTDDQCGAPRRASVVGLAFPNPDGSIGFGLTTVTTPGGTPIHIDAAIQLATLSGPWRDSAGATGNFVFTPGAGAAGPPRPVPVGGIAPGTLTSAHLAPGAITATHLAPAAVAGSLSTLGTCPAGSMLRGYEADGTLACSSPTGPDSVTIPTPGSASGVQSSIVVPADGRPIVAHWASGLRVTRCLDASCTGWTAATVDPAGGYWTSIAVGTDGLPLISHKTSSGALRVTHCHDLDCTASTSTTLDPAGGQTNQTSIAIGVDGRGIVSHGTGDALRVTHCTDVACTAATSTTVDDPASVVGAFSSLAIGADGFAVVSHHDFTNGLRVTHCSNTACTAATTEVVGGGDGTVNSFGLYTAIAVGGNNLPLISHAVSAGRLRVTQCGTITCSASVTTTLDAPGTPVGRFSDLAIGADGLAVISHHDAALGALRVTRCTDGVCSAATTTVADDPPASVGTGTAIAIGANGFPVVSHLDATTSALRITTCRSRSCQ